MRKGTNTSKEQTISKREVNHRVIIPLYIPHTDEYYSEAFEIFEMTLMSLHKTSTYPNLVSVISDHCCDSINYKLLELKEKKLIDELVIQTQNIGKLNAILKVLRTVDEEFVTITDADVLFVNDWDKEVFHVFSSFPKAAVVSPVPVFRNQLSYTANIWVDYFFSKKLAFQPVKNPDALEKFAKSIGWDSLEPRFKDVIVTLKAENDTLAVVSATHFVATYKKEYLKNIPKENSIFKLGGNSEGKYLDKPPFDLDGYRLATYDNYAYHLGNKTELWQKEYYSALSETEKIPFPAISNFKPGKSFVKKIIEKLLVKALSNTKIYNMLLLRKGLTKQQLKTFWY
ncbi:glycosyltransferase family protein [Flavobacterium difficile]|uniref:Glycosyltransferase n=1 Tax=Flavobacterium difficile TaxID=2709659 RepID=A0ABX0I5U9_9FLAO|nr:glycosyltransferase [Flavobacterium difficile]NHM01122.1 glycosyltransferase [Flavobacterium difficile]